MYFHIKQVPFNTVTWQIVTTKPQSLTEDSEENPDALIPLIKRDPDQIPLSLWGPVPHIKNELGGGGFPGVPVVRTQCFHCREMGSIPGWGFKIPKATRGTPPPKKNQEWMDCSRPSQRNSKVWYIMILWLTDWGPIQSSLEEGCC